LEFLKNETKAKTGGIIPEILADIACEVFEIKKKS